VTEAAADVKLLVDSLYLVSALDYASITGATYPVCACCSYRGRIITSKRNYTQILPKSREYLVHTLSVLAHLKSGRRL